MNYIAKHLNKDEKIVYQGSMHWIIFVWPIVFTLLLSLFILFLTFWLDVNFVWLLLPVILLGFFGLLFARLVHNHSEFAVTDHRVAVKMGIIAIKTDDIMLDQIESVDFDQTILGKILGYGSVVVVGSGTSKIELAYLSDPETFQQRVQAQIPDIKPA